jgi:large subunit ribosomal protein L19
MITSENLQKRDVTFKPGDTVRVHYRVIEGNRERVQIFEGLCISRKGSGIHETFTVRKNSFGVNVERIFPLHSPKIAKIEVASRGAVRRAKLYYIRDKVGKKARVKKARSDRTAVVTGSLEEPSSRGEFALRFRCGLDPPPQRAAGGGR